MTVERLLASIGKSTFVKYYYNFKDRSRDFCISNFEENFSEKSKSSRTGHAQMIFRNNMEKEALEIIVSSSRLVSEIIEIAKKILANEFN